MRFATFSTAVAGLVLVAMVTSAEAGKRDEAASSGTFVSAAAGKLVMVGRDGKEQTHSVAKDAKVTIDGKSGGVDALKKGMKLTLTTDKSGTVTAIKASADKGSTSTKPVARPAPRAAK